MPTLDWKPEANDVIIPCVAISNPLGGCLILNISQNNGPIRCRKKHSKSFMLQKPSSKNLRLQFINYIAGQEVTTVGDDYESCTVKLLPAVIESLRSDFPKDRRLVLVDTPGFGDTNDNDADILYDIGSWLETMYDSRDSHGHGETKLAGIVYLHDISLSRMQEPISKSFVVFRSLCGKDALKHVVICTTKWSTISKEEEAESRTEQLKEKYWKEMIEGGSIVHKFQDSQNSAWDVIAPIVEKGRYGKMDALQIQEEMVEGRKLIPETEAGRQLRYSLDQLLKFFEQASSKDSSRRRELDAKIAAIRKQMRVKRVPVTQRILESLGRKQDRESTKVKSRITNGSDPDFRDASDGVDIIIP